MSVLDRLTQIQNGWGVALGAGFVFILLTFIVGMIIVCAIKSINTDKVFSFMTIIIVILVGEIVISLAGLFISSAQVSKTRYYPDKYNIEQMAIDYDARELEDNNAKDDYIIHYEGYGSEEWILFTSPKHEQNQY